MKPHSFTQFSSVSTEVNVKTDSLRLKTITTITKKTYTLSKRNKKLLQLQAKSIDVWLIELPWD
jgi:hypothetical protein